MATRGKGEAIHVVIHLIYSVPNAIPSHTIAPSRVINTIHEPVAQLNQWITIHITPTTHLVIAIE